MRKLMLAVLPAFLLTACLGSTHSTLSYFAINPGGTGGGDEAVHRDARASAAGR